MLDLVALRSYSRPQAGSPAASRAEGSGSSEREPAPDLVVDALIPSQSFPMPGSALWYMARVRNQGDAPAGPFTVDLRSVGGFDSERVAAGLAPGASVNLQLGPAWVSFPGSSFSAQVVVDERGEVPERNEGNNYQWSTVWVQQPVPPIPMPPHPAAPPAVLLAE